MQFLRKMNSLLRILTLSPRPKTASVILAGGVGSRMQLKDGATKQLMLLEGLPVLIHTLRAFDKSACIDEQVLVVRREEMEQVKKLVAVYAFKKPIRIVAGGKTRQLSALAGFEAVSPKMKFVAIHDAARCLVTDETITKVVNAAYASKCASAATPVKDTIKLADANGYIKETPDRAFLWQALTPQVFRCDIYRVAAYTALRDKITVTDDNMLMEHIGQAVRLVECPDENIKLTTPADVYFAKAILKARKTDE